MLCELGLGQGHVFRLFMRLRRINVTVTLSHQFITFLSFDIGHSLEI